MRRCGRGLLVTLAGSPSQSKPVGFARFPLLSLTRHLFLSLSPAVTFLPGRGESVPAGGSLSSKWDPLAVHANVISLPRPLPLGEVDANVASRRRGRGCCPCTMCLFPSPLLQFVQLRQLFVKKFHLRGGENRRRERGRVAFKSEEFFIGNTEKSSCKLTTKGV